jgi:hypothetical protein
VGAMARQRTKGDVPLGPRGYAACRTTKGDDPLEPPRGYAAI